MDHLEYWHLGLDFYVLIEIEDFYHSIETEALRAT
jgi:hypothetical protein